MSTAKCSPRLILRLWGTRPSGRPVVLPSTSVSTVDLVPATPGMSTTRRYGALHQPQIARCTTLHAREEFFSPGPPPSSQEVACLADGPSGRMGAVPWTELRETHGLRPLIECSWLSPRRQDVPLSVSYGRKSITWARASPELTRKAEPTRITPSSFWCRKFHPLSFPKNCFTRHEQYGKPGSGSFRGVFVRPTAWGFTSTDPRRRPRRRIFSVSLNGLH